MEMQKSWRPFWSVSVVLLGAAVGMFLTGTRADLAMSVFFMAAGIGGVLGKPTRRLRWIPLILGFLYLATTLLVHLPVGWFSEAAWRAGFPVTTLFAQSGEVAMMPWVAWWWTMILGATVLTGFVVISSPLRGRELSALLHVASAVVAVYALVSIIVWQTGWKFAGVGNGVFGLLPNRNHTATLLAVGAIVSFGLMQWELTHENRVAAVFSALCGAPSVAALLFFSISRAGVLLLIVGFVMWAIGAARGASNRRALGISAAVLVIFLFGLFIFGGSQVRDRLGSLWNQALATQAGEEEAANLDFRMPVFKDTIEMISDAPWTGVGMGHFDFVFPHYRKASLREVQVLHPESNWLLVLAESGVFAVLALLGLVVWYFVVCWRSLEREDGLLRWTGASAIGMAVLHGGIDVPWQRLVLGWFFMVLALAMVPPRKEAVRLPRLMRSWQIFVGVLLLGLAGCLYWQNASNRPTIPFRWDAYQSELNKLREQKKNDLGEFVAKEAIRDFPLNPYAYLWHMSFLSSFYGSEGEMQESEMLAKYVDPVQPRIESGAAAMWVGIDAGEEAQARLEAVRRTVEIAKAGGKTADLGFAGEQIRLANQSAKDRLEVQEMIGDGVVGEPVLLAYWMQSADAGLVGKRIAAFGDLGGFLDGLPEALRLSLLNKLATLADTTRVMGYMEARPQEYWRPLAKTRAASGDKKAAVEIVMAGVGTETSGEFGKEIAALEAQGNDVAVRRLLREAVAMKVPDAEKLRIAMASYAAAGDWEMAWKAASRLAFEVKSTQ